ncbi:MAG: hypothetical protein IH787_08505 [Nitrospirae bacterium]|nr:hypothetical protein [Nitrospirota bacterium]
MLLRDVAEVFLEDYPRQMREIGQAVRLSDAEKLQPALVVAGIRRLGGALVHRN